MSWLKHSSDFHDLVDVEMIRDTLIEWFASNARPLPWRDETLPNRAYAVLVAEIMSQQTRIEVSARKWTEWMTVWPTPAALAAASDEQVRAAWAGLGYYRRAANLHKAAKAICEMPQDQVPTTYDELCKLPGVGPYTAGAVASTVFGQKVPAVDGNVVRVICRLGAVRATAAKAHRHCTAQATRLLPEESGPLCGQLNEALIEFGATVCTPRKPLCDQCPLKAHCRAFAEVSDACVDPPIVGDIEDDVCSLCASRAGDDDDDAPIERPTAVTVFPLTAVKTKQRVEHTVVCFVEVRSGDNRQVLVPIVQRPVHGLLGGFFELPQVTIAVDQSADAQARRTAADRLLASLLGVDDAALVVERRDCGTVGHLFSHIRQTMFVEHVVLAPAAKELIDNRILQRGQEARTVKLVTHQQVTDDAVSAGNHKAIKLALTGAGGEKSTKKRKAL